MHPPPPTTLLTGRSARGWRPASAVRTRTAAVGLVLLLAPWATGCGGEAASEGAPDDAPAPGAREGAADTTGASFAVPGPMLPALGFGGVGFVAGEVVVRRAPSAASAALDTVSQGRFVELAGRREPGGADGGDPQRWLQVRADEMTGPAATGWVPADRVGLPHTEGEEGGVRVFRRVRLGGPGALYDVVIGRHEPALRGLLYEHAHTFDAPGAARVFFSDGLERYVVADDVEGRLEVGDVIVGQVTYRGPLAGDAGRVSVVDEALLFRQPDPESGGAKRRWLLAPPVVETLTSLLVPVDQVELRAEPGPRAGPAPHPLEATRWKRGTATGRVELHPLNAGEETLHYEVVLDGDTGWVAAPDLAFPVHPAESDLPLFRRNHRLSPHLRSFVVLDLAGDLIRSFDLLVSSSYIRFASSGRWYVVVTPLEGLELHEVRETTTGVLLERFRGEDARWQRGEVVYRDREGEKTFRPASAEPVDGKGRNAAGRRYLIAGEEAELLTRPDGGGELVTVLGPWAELRGTGRVWAEEAEGEPEYPYYEVEADGRVGWVEGPPLARRVAVDPDGARALYAWTDLFDAGETRYHLVEPGGGPIRSWRERSGAVFSRSLRHYAVERRTESGGGWVLRVVDARSGEIVYEEPTRTGLSRPEWQGEVLEYRALVGEEADGTPVTEERRLDPRG